MEQDAVGFLGVRPLAGMAQAGDAAHLHAHPLLRLKDGAGAEGIAAVQRQRMVKDVKHPGHGPAT